MNQWNENAAGMGSAAAKKKLRENTTPTITPSSISRNSTEMLLSRLDGVRETGPDRWLARCPAHDDRHPSLSIRDAGDRVLIHCFGGCAAADVVAALGLSLGDLFPERLSHSHPMRRRIPSADAWDAVAHEVTVVAVIGADFRKHRELDEDTWDRLALAVERITAARDLYTRKVRL